MASRPKHPPGGAGLPGGAALGLAVCVDPHGLLPRGGGRAGRRGPGSLLLVFLPALPSCSQSDAGSQTGRAGTEGCWHPPVLTPRRASLPPAFWGKGCRAASDWPSWEQGGGGRGGWTRASVFNFSFFPLSFFPPKFLVFLPRFPLRAPSRRLLAQDVRGCLEIPQPTPASR